MYITPLKNNDRLTGRIGKRGSAVFFFFLINYGKQEEQESDGEFPGMKDFQ